MKRSFLFIIIILQALLIRAQLNDFNLSSYKLPALTQHQLETSIDLGGNHANNNQDYGSGYYNDSRNLSMDAGINLYYSFFRNSVKVQNRQTISGSFAPGYNTSSGEQKAVLEQWGHPGFYSLQTFTDKNVTSNIAASLNITSSTKYYFDAKCYMEPGFDLDYRYTDQHSDLTNVQGVNYNADINTKTKQNNIVPGLSFGIGYGRIEPVQDARLAVYILQDLDKFHRLKRIPNHDEIIAFAGMISTEKNKRIFDSRIKKIEEIKAVDSFLQSNGLITSGDATYFTLLNDNWTNANGPVRLAGVNITLGCMSDLDYDDYYQRYKQIITDTSGIANTGFNLSNSYEMHASVNPFVRFIYEKPLSLRWQSSTHAEASYGRLYNDNNNLLSNGWEIRGTASQQFGFYPDTRTAVTMGLNVQLQRYALGMNDQRFLLTPGLSLNATHYFSYRLRMECRYNMLYTHDDIAEPHSANKRNNNFNQTLSLRLMYSIF